MNDSDKESNAVTSYSITVNSSGGDGGSLILQKGRKESCRKSGLAGSPVDSVLFTTAASAPAA